MHTHQQAFEAILWRAVTLGLGYSAAVSINKCILHRVCDLALQPREAVWIIITMAFHSLVPLAVIFGPRRLKFFFVLSASH